MKRVILILLVFIQTFQGFGQAKYWERVHFGSTTLQLGVSPSEEVWVIVAARLNSYYTSKFGNALQSFDVSRLGYQKEDNHPCRMHFFSRDTLIISSVATYGTSNKNLVHWSGDGGKTWKKIKIDSLDNVNASHALRDGKIWLGDESLNIFFSSDFGKNWKKVGRLKAPKHVDIQNIYFDKTAQNGLVSLTSGKLYRTKDNCKTWEELPTPATQKKYRKAYKESKETIEKVQQLGNSYLIKQQNKIFISDVHQINWRRLPNVRHFEVDTHNDKVYIINDDRTVDCYKTGLKLLWHSNHKILGDIMDLEIQNDHLYVLAYKFLYKVGKDLFKKNDMVVKDKFIYPPSNKIAYKGDTLGFSYGDILRQEKGSGKWYRHMTADFYIYDHIIYQNQLLIRGKASPQPQYYLVDFKRKKLKQFEFPASLVDLNKNPITNFRLYTGSSGCYHKENAVKVYYASDKCFKLNMATSHSHYLINMPYKIPKNTIYQLFHTIQKSRFESLKLTDLAFSKQDIESFKKFIDREAKKYKKSNDYSYDIYNFYRFPGNNTNLEFYKSVADTLDRLSPQTIAEAFLNDLRPSGTSHYWRGVSFDFKDGSTLSVTNSGEYPGYYYLPWKVTYKKALIFKSNSLKFSRLLHKLTKGSLFLKVPQEKNYALFQIANKLYLDRLYD